MCGAADKLVKETALKSAPIRPLLAVPDNGYPARIYSSFDAELRNIADQVFALR